MVTRNGDFIFFESPGKVLKFDCSSGVYDVIDTATGWALISQATAGFNDRTLRDGRLTFEIGKAKLDIFCFFEAENIKLRITISLHPRKMAFVFDMSLTNLSLSPREIQRISPFMLMTERGGALLLHGPSAYIQGYQSWDACAVKRLLPRKTYSYRSHWMTALEDYSRAASLLLGFISFSRALSHVSLEGSGEGYSISAQCLFDGLAVLPDRTISSERFVLTTAGSSYEAIEIWADMAAREMKVPGPGLTTAGWCSWYHAREHIDQAYIERIIDHGAMMGALDYIQVDDGYQYAEGDWLLCNDRFPGTIKSLAERAHQKNLLFGLWVAPFMVSRFSTVFKTHPEWLLKGKSGSPLPLYEWRSGSMYGLDCSHPEAQKWLAHTFAVMADDWGVDMFKLDFLFLGAMQGRRHRNSWTSAQAYRKGIEIIREAVGKRFLLFCGAPLGPSAGIADAMRISGDVGPCWYGELSASTSISNTLLRAPLHRRLWINDPDCVIVREAENSLTEAETETLLTVAALSGGLVSFSDDIAGLSDRRKDMLMKILPSYGQSAVPLMAEGGSLPDEMDLRVDRSFAAWHVVALLNFSDYQSERSFNLSTLGMRKKEYLVYEFWTDTFLGKVSGAIQPLEIPPHGVRLLCVRTALPHPQLLSSGFHVTQGAVELSCCHWKRRDKVLTVKVKKMPCREGVFLFHAPSPFRIKYVNCTAEQFSFRTRNDGLLSLSCATGDPFEITLTYA